MGLNSKIHQQFSEAEKEKVNIEVWEDLVNIKDLVLTLLICSLTTLGAFFLAPNDPPKPLFYGLLGALIGFVITCFIINPKRDLLIDESED